VVEIELACRFQRSQSKAWLERTPPGGSTIEGAKVRRGAASGWRLRRAPDSLNEPDVAGRHPRPRSGGLHF